MVGTLLTQWFGYPNGSVLTNLIASALWVTPTMWLFIRHHKCRDCLRPGTVPVNGTVHKVCKKHALIGGHVHTAGRMVRGHGRNH